MPRYATSVRTYITTGEEIGSGGEANVYEIIKYPSWVAKIYHPDKREGRERKLQLMIGNPPKDDTRNLQPPHISIAWPVDLLYEKDKFAGYVMPHIKQSPDIFKIYSPRLRTQQYPEFDWRYLHRTAYNLATAMNAIHMQGYVIGDVNERNIMVARNALVTLVDTDSFQVKDSFHKMIYRCPVGVDEYTPPELLGKEFKDVDRETYHDRFGLAVLIFKLLMEGTHPFTGVPQFKFDGNILVYCIEQGIFPHTAKHVRVLPSPLAPDFQTLHPHIQQLFERSFVHGYNHPAARPTAREWLNALKEAEKTLVQCNKDATHWYSQHWERCHWCERTQVETPKVIILEEESNPKIELGMPIFIIVGIILGLSVNMMGIQVTPLMTDSGLEPVASAAKGASPILGSIFGGITGMIVHSSSEKKTFSATEFWDGVFMGAISGIIQAVLLLIIGFIAMEGFLLTVIWILMVFPVIIAVIGMAPLVVSTILAGAVWGIGFGLVRLALLRYIK